MAQSSGTSELRRLQLGHEGVRLVLCSKINEAEDLFKKTRFVFPVGEINGVCTYMIIDLKGPSYMLATVQLYSW